ncbi:hypothetical protein HK44_008855 [Pseudomonas fluorescens HK44]|uniref:DUF3742 domain-containing protein n=1 Tax=Pseudomonas fluorescens HK44 TaxID=1042209 RepID=A0A010SRX4_PSEFL|nr:DUF3742 family protein [Pseudomonas fluorescens]EXF93743.1 hypothetical protein HK44_008855 [Pseudomonas fluorescens HK44]
MHTHNERWTYRFGQGMGRVWRAYVRRERQAVGWLNAHGVPVSIAKMLLWLVKLVLFGLLLYVAFWLTLILLFSIAAAWASGHNSPNEEDEWPFMDQDELRKSMFYDPVSNNDTSHEMYEDDQSGR